MATTTNLANPVKLAILHIIAIIQGADMSVSRAIVEQNGRILLSAAIRKQLGIAPGDEVVLRIEGDELRVAAVGAAVRRAQTAVRRHLREQGSLADDVIAMRKQDARRE